MPTSLACVIEAPMANEIIRRLMIEDLIRKDLKIKKIENEIFIPVKDGTNLQQCRIVYSDFDERHYENIKQTMASFIKRNGGDERSLPDKWIKLGDAIFVKELIDQTTFEAFERFMGVRRAYLYESVRGVERIPVVRHLYGLRGEIRHVEDGLTYFFDPEKIMFSAGNTNERTRIREMKLDGMTVLDMFAGIGYFTLPAVKYGHAEHTDACDINPEAIKFLKKNLSANGISKSVKPICGDARIACPIKAYDLIIMGNFKSIEYLPAALIRSKAGTKIILHHLVSQERLSKFIYDLENYCISLGYFTSIQEWHIVKSYSPKMFHVATTLEILKVQE
ncbi:hypothetical protein [Thermoplasma volcanium GSS1]|uniref:SAM-dependent methyltransferase TRM5/TYW2-type domain-containing protein n=1 Tax=Thermoplasma volcanium (strain ATCC 51530 / DSM 4299 / JCM 9571 / NBRC 15438 / GSS1) TaxID=273116 RepID=Q979R1_THEVO|nr:class I SAM-dependent methyltransferase family protein [Thermoplasma volcanium]BAB60241.1 hypothetical protein [Thermoplasma volcanium GSS1]